MANRWADDGRKLLKDNPKCKGLDWSERMNYAAMKINEVKPTTLYDFGCGSCDIKNKISSDIEYVGYDSITHSKFVNVIDLNVEKPIIKSDGSLGLFLGILEYIDNLNSFYNFINTSFHHFIFSCLDKDYQKYFDLFDKSYKIQCIKKDLKLPPNQSIYYCVKK